MAVMWKKSLIYTGKWAFLPEITGRNQKINDGIITA
jgi:hypothetical protein